MGLGGREGRSPDDRAAGPLASRALWIGAAALLVLRLAALVAVTPADGPLTGDEPAYAELARNLAGGHGYALDGEPWVRRPPGWPVALAGIQAVLGESRRAVVLFQGLFDAGAALAFAWLAGRLHRSRAAAVLTFLAVALWPPFFRESRFMQTEPLFTLGVALLAGACARLAVRPTAGAALLTGVLAGLAVLVRPTGLALLAGLLLGWFLRDAGPVRRRATGLVLVVAGLALALAPWTARNALVFGRFVPVSTGGGEMFLTGAALETGGRWRPEVFLPLVDRVVAGEAVRLGRAPDPVEIDRAMLRAGLEAWRHEPLTSLSIAAKRVYRLCFVPLSAEDRPGLRLAFLVTLLALYVLAVPEGLAGFRERGGWPAFRAILLVGVATYVLAVSFFYTNSRYMEPVRPLLVVLAVGPVVRRLHRARPGGTAR
jgi:4-amino-4-deoxy-L-arabinose transferase-like glycosyltransferase